MRSLFVCHVRVSIETGKREASKTHEVCLPGELARESFLLGLRLRSAALSNEREIHAKVEVGLRSRTASKSSRPWSRDAFVCWTAIPCECLRH